MPHILVCIMSFLNDVIQGHHCKAETRETRPVLLHKCLSQEVVIHWSCIATTYCTQGYAGMEVDVITTKGMLATEFTMVLSLCLIDGFVCGCENEMVVDSCKSIRRF